MGNTPPHVKRHHSSDSLHLTLNEYGHSPFAGVSIHAPKRRNMNKRSSMHRKTSDDDDYGLSYSLLNDSGGLPIPGVDVSTVTSMFRHANLNVEDRHSRKQRAESTCCVFPAGESARFGGCLDSSNTAGFKFDELVEREERLVPTVFSWKGGGSNIAVSGTFNNWGEKVPLVRRNSGTCIIIDCPPGQHEYKYFIDGAWYHDPTKPVTENKYGTKNNIVLVKEEDYDPLEALEQDIANSNHQHDETSQVDSHGHSPPGNYGQVVPPNPDTPMHSPFAPSLLRRDNQIVRPPTLPPYLVQGILNQDTQVHCDPNLLPPPNHVMLNHLYALSIKNGVIVLSVIGRYREKFVSTLFYKPIQD